MIPLIVVGAVVGAVVGFVVRPAVPFFGQLPFEIVITRGASLGDSRDMVQSALGAPERVIDLGPKAVFVHRDLKITFTDGRVVDVE
jgi:hypothetical protein